MRRLLALLTSGMVVFVVGCGSRSYQARLDKTYALLQYQDRVDKALMPAAKESLEQNLIYIRPPKNLAKMKEFSLTVLEPGKFDVAETFVEGDALKLHVLARVKKLKDPKKKAAAEPPATDFRGDILSIINNIFSVELDGNKAKEETKKKNKFRHLSFEVSGKVVQVYLYGDKATSHQVALVFEYTKGADASSKIDLCLETFAVGEKARQAFSGNDTMEDAVEGTPASGGNVAF
jgi:hypothetical protein